MMIKCTNCKRNLNESNFYARKRYGRVDGHVPECKECFKGRMSNRHQKHKEILVQEFGGKCSRCGYDRCTRILCFHHLSEHKKSFEISDRLSANLKILREEAKKCILLCPNCHGEVHQGL